MPRLSDVNSALIHAMRALVGAGRGYQGGGGYGGRGGFNDHYNKPDFRRERTFDRNPQPYQRRDNRYPCSTSA